MYSSPTAALLFAGAILCVVFPGHSEQLTAVPAERAPATALDKAAEGQLVELRKNAEAIDQALVQTNKDIKALLNDTDTDRADLRDKVDKAYTDLQAALTHVFDETKPGSELIGGLVKAISQFRIRQNKFADMPSPENKQLSDEWGKRLTETIKRKDIFLEENRRLGEALADLERHKNVLFEMLLLREADQLIAEMAKVQDSMKAISTQILSLSNSPGM